ncbi:hypothetical protein TNCV_3783611 [Trichonephila clavipes]|nr:hypothetical protein TNCV_3783611 [Trichonephila clavipes]
MWKFSKCTHTLFTATHSNPKHSSSCNELFQNRVRRLKMQPIDLFFGTIKAAQRLNLSSKKRRRQHHHPDAEPPPFLTNFAEILRVSPPSVPPSLLRSVGRKENFSIGKNIESVVSIILYKESDIYSFIKRIKWADHVVRIDEDHTIKKSLMPNQLAHGEN